MSYHSDQNRLHKDYSDDWDAFVHNLKSKSTLDLTYYARNLVSAATRVEGEDDFANALFEKLTRRARLVNTELKQRGTYNAPRTTPDERKRRIAELSRDLPPDVQATLPAGSVGTSTGATYRDPPIPTRITPLVPTPGGAFRRSPPSPDPLGTDERLSEDEDTEPLSPYKKFKKDEEQQGEDK